MAVYKKPKDLKYTDMAIYIDKHVYTDDCDDELVFKYLYFLCMMLAYKARYFDTYQKYEDFAVSAATSTYLRLKSKRQFEYKDNGEVKLKPIRSILNYLKASIYGLKVNFQQETYAQYSTQNAVENYICNTEINLHDQMVRTVDELNRSEFRIYLEDISGIIKEVLVESPYYADRKTWLNIYLSCLLTLQNSITLPRKILYKISESNISPTVMTNIINRTMQIENQDPVILFHLSEDFHNYVLLMTRKVRKIIAQDLSSILHTYVSVDTTNFLLMKDSIEDFNEN